MSTYLRIFALLLLGVAASAARADDLFPAATSSDLAARMLDALFGNPDGATSANLLGAAMGHVNRYALGFGTLMFTYVAVIGTLNTAQDGEILGRKWSSMWIPLRFTLGVALMVPAASGYSAAQSAVLTLAHGGSYAATWVWQASVSQLAGGNDRLAATFNNAAYTQGVDAAMRTIWRAEACAAGFRDRMNLNTEAPTEFRLHGQQMRDGSYLVQWGDPAVAAFAPDQCGSLRTTAYEASEPPTLTMVDGMGSSVEVQSTRRDGYDQAMAAVVPAQYAGLLAAAAELRPTAAAAAGACGVAGRPNCPAGTVGKQAVEAAIARASRIYTTSVESALARVYAQLSGGADLVQRAAKDGWAMAGTSLFNMARIQSQINALGSWMPQVTPPAQSASSVGVGADDIDSVSWSNRMADATDSAGTSPGRGILKWVSKKLGGDPSDKRHILVQVKDTGDYIMGVAQAGLVAVGVANSIPGGGVVAKGLGGAAQFIPGGEVLSSLGKAGAVALGALYASGVVMSLVLPMLPFSLWFGSFVGWLIAVLELLVATPLWLAAHLHPEGDDVVGKGGGGYMILLEVVARPCIMVIGLIGAFLLTDHVGRFLGYAYFSTVDQVQADSTTGITSIVVLVVLYVALFFTTLRTCFGLTHSLHATIMRFFGGAHASHDKAEEYGATVTHQQNSGVAQAQSALGNAGAQLSRGVSLRPRQSQAPRRANSDGGGSIESGNG